MRAFILAAAVVLLAGCTTVAQYRRPDGGTNFVVACGAAVGWNICFDQARKECPIGFDVLSQVNDGNRKELAIACNDQPQAAVDPAARAAAACRLRVAETPGALSSAERQARVRDCILAAGYRPDGL